MCIMRARGGRTTSTRTQVHRQRYSPIRATEADLPAAAEAVVEVDVEALIVADEFALSDDS